MNLRYEHKTSLFLHTPFSHSPFIVLMSVKLFVPLAVSNCIRTNNSNQSNGQSIRWLRYNYPWNQSRYGTFAAFTAICSDSFRAFAIGTGHCNHYILQCDLRNSKRSSSGAYNTFEYACIVTKFDGVLLPGALVLRNHRFGQRREVGSIV